MQEARAMLIEELACELNEIFSGTGIASVLAGKHNGEEILLVSSWMDGMGKVARVNRRRLKPTAC